MADDPMRRGAAASSAAARVASIDSLAAIG
jgi:hypothetical protein